MDGFIALSTAANICQFIEYGFKILNQINKLRKDGVVDPDLKRDTARLKGVADKLVQQPIGYGGLDNLATDCVGLSQRLMEELSRMKPRGPNSKWQSFKAVIRSEYKKRGNAELEAKLERCRSQLNLELVDLTRLETGEKLRKISESGHALQSEVLALRTSLNQLQPTLAAHYVGEDISELIKSFVNRMDKALKRVRQTSILNLVKFPEVHERFDLVADAHQETFDWLLNEDGDEEDSPKSVSDSTASLVHSDDEVESMFSSSSNLWGDSSIDEIDLSLAKARNEFTSWLEHEGSAFWITGKPGASKSTLVKHICLHEGPTKRLGVWASGRKLALGEGLLRGLLYSTLEGSPDLIPIAFPELWDMTDSATAILPIAFEHRDILRGFRNILEGTLRTPYYKLAFFIDGLDEFEGRQVELLQELNSWMKAYPKHVKLCVSSREYSIFQEYLSVYPTIQLHLLTERDIRKSVSHSLDHISGRLGLDFFEMEGIQRIIVKKAEGVFLWVSLILGSIEDGLISGDNVSDLIERIEHCPTELEALFKQLLDFVHPADRIYTFSILKWVVYLQSVNEGIEKMPTPAFHFIQPASLSLVELSSLDLTEAELWERAFGYDKDPERSIQDLRRKVYGRRGIRPVSGLNERFSLIHQVQHITKL
ncbi:hypothetical protein PG994_000124 [Apiospora phragmitis]|uniref:Nephrocystin 3-like N-terminal domain-containing protein n=1 Tax=Apiospora phragmitis TaxID=2905665 RepID=A0ABR1X5J4_9PEZI